eukprot:GFUD01018081.1.p1 GENE.GFUD01018081.1~~GFUD01018081.1.p1  ORF type:complete len:446 (-),score=97.13 GFUD01018081.1:359-1696(-)
MSRGNNTPHFCLGSYHPHNLPPVTQGPRPHWWVPQGTPVPPTLQQLRSRADLYHQQRQTSMHPPNPSHPPGQTFQPLPTLYHQPSGDNPTPNSEVQVVNTNQGPTSNQFQVLPVPFSRQVPPPNTQQGPPPYTQEGLPPYNQQGLPSNQLQGLSGLQHVTVRRLPQHPPHHQWSGGPVTIGSDLVPGTFEEDVTSQFGLPSGTVAVRVTETGNVIPAQLSNAAPGQVDAPKNIQSTAAAQKLQKRKCEEETTKNKKVKEIVSRLEDTTQSMVESEEQRSELDDELQVKLAMYESKCLAEKLELDERQQLEMENLLDGHTMESQRLDLKRKSGLKAIQDDHEHVKNNLKKQISEIRSIMKTLKLKLSSITTSLELNCPECPICFESFQPPKKIIQCVNGHLLCLECRQKPEVQDCPTCREGLTGRATAYEQLLSQMFGVVEEGKSG